jgi:hypothetical protein
MSEPDNPRWLDRLSGELRQEVPVRAAWRAQLLDEVARSPRPTPVTADAKAPGRRVVLHPLAALAAALVFAVAGAGATLFVMSGRGVAKQSELANASGATSATPAAAAGALAGASVVRFELSAPTASRVALVGSFNRWNPVATPLERDPATGRWMVALTLPAGRHVYAFVVDGDVTADPAAPRAADTDFGPPNSVVLVAEKSS